MSLLILPRRANAPARGRLLLTLRRDNVQQLVITIQAELPKHRSPEVHVSNIAALDRQGLWIVIGNVASGSARTRSRCESTSAHG
jgi:hypothetical protein